MSRVTIGASLLLVLLCLPNPVSAQSEGGRGGEGGTGGYGGEGGYSGEGGYGEPGTSVTGGRGGYGGRGGVGGAASEGDNPFGSGQAGGESIQRRSQSRGRVTSAVNEIEAALNAKLKAPLQYEDVPINEVINTLQEEYDIPILFDNSALEDVAISPDTQITINLRNVTLRSALRLMLRQPGLEDLTFVVDDEVLLITTEDRANEKLDVKVYRVEDLVGDYPQSRGGNDNNPYSSLSQVITSCVEYDTWMANGKGEGEIQLMMPGMLVVAQTQKVHDRVQDLLEKLRASKLEIDQSSSGGARGGGGRGSF